MGEPQFEYDVFISHSAKDKPVVQKVAERLRADGLRVWFDAWEILPGDSIPAKIEAGLERSRVLVLCMSSNAFGSDWAQLEAGTFRFRDPLNKDRRFLPLRLDDTPAPGSLGQFSSIHWQGTDREGQYVKLLEACRQPEMNTSFDGEEPEELYAEKGVSFETDAALSSFAFGVEDGFVLAGSFGDSKVRVWDLEMRRCVQELEGHEERVNQVALSPDCRRALSSSHDKTIRLWNLDTGYCEQVLKGHRDAVWGVAWSHDGHHIVSGGWGGVVRLWDVQTGDCVRALEGHEDLIYSVSITVDGHHIVSGGADREIRVWDAATGRCLRVLEGSRCEITAALVSSAGGRILSCDSATEFNEDFGALRLWDAQTGHCSKVLEGHDGWVGSLVWSTDERFALTGGSDEIIRLWDLEQGICRYMLKGHTESIRGLYWSSDGRRAISADESGHILFWKLPELVKAPVCPAPVSTTPPDISTDVQYTNAKVLLVGESGAGKTGLSKRLALNDWEPSDSTVGAWASQWKLPVEAEDGVEREIWLWDFGGQADQRLIHQLYMDETALAVLVFDGQKDDVFETLSQWDRDLTRASRTEFSKLLVAGRTDAGGLRCSPNQVEAFADERGYSKFLETSAKVGTGCETLKQAIVDGIRWQDIPWRTSPRVFKRLKEEILRLKDEGRVLMRFNELRETLALRLGGAVEASTGEISAALGRFSDAELRAVVGLLAGPGAVWSLKFGEWVLLQPERINAYAQAVIQTLREDRFERGCLFEERVLAGDLAYRASLPRLPKDEERIVLLAMHEALIERALCLREHTEDGTLLIFPSYYRRERKELTGHPAVHVSYRFQGFLDDIYATLVVRLHHTQTIKNNELWRYAADFQTLTGKQLGVKLTRLGEGAGELSVYFEPAIPVEEKIIFSKYVHEHVMQKGKAVERLRHYVCPHCGTPAENRTVAMKKLHRWMDGPDRR